MDDDGDFGVDADFIAALVGSGSGPSRAAPSGQPSPRVQQPTPQRIQQPTPQKIQQPAPQRIDRPPPSNASASTSGTKIVQPTPQALPSRPSGSSILVSPRQKGNPVLACLKSLPWEYSDIPADYGLGLTTCALFLSLKYHRLHPEYIYTRIRNLQGKYNLRILLTMVDIPNHEDSLREMSKTSLVNNVTIILCWSAAEAARYLELYKSYEHANFAAIRGQQATSYAERLVEFVTVPRSVNKTDAIALVSSFGSLRNAINADPEQIGVISGWGEKKVKSWCKVVEEPFRVQKAAKRQRATQGDGSALSNKLDQAIPINRAPPREMAGRTTPAKTPAAAAGSGGTQQQSISRQDQIWNPNIDEDEEEVMMAAAIAESQRTAASGNASSARREEHLSDGVAAALARLREKG